MSIRDQITAAMAAVNDLLGEALEYRTVSATRDPGRGTWNNFTGRLTITHTSLEGIRGEFTHDEMAVLRTDVGETAMTLRDRVRRDGGDEWEIVAIRERIGGRYYECKQITADGAGPDRGEVRT